MCSKAEKTKRVDIVLALIAEGAETSQILHYLAQKTDWGKSERTAKWYISAATEAMKPESEEFRETMRNKRRHQLQFIHRKQVEEKQWRGAKETLAELIKLDGLDAPTHIINEYRKISDDELKRRAANMFAGDGAPGPLAENPSRAEAGTRTIPSVP